MKSTKYQLLKDDFDKAVRDLKEYRILIQDLRQENKDLKALVKSYERYFEENSVEAIEKQLEPYYEEMARLDK